MPKHDEHLTTDIHEAEQWFGPGLPDERGEYPKWYTDIMSGKPVMVGGGLTPEEIRAGRASDSWYDNIPQIMGAAVGAGIGASGFVPGAEAASVPDFGAENLFRPEGGAPWSPGGTPMMPPAVPETAEQLKTWGLRETAPGQWSLPGGLFPGAAASVLPALVEKLGPAAAQSVFSKILNGSATTDDWLKLIGQVGPGILGMLGANSRQDAFERLASRYDEYGAPYRARLAETYRDPMGYLNSPEVQGPTQLATDKLMHSLSTTGNPWGSPNALQKAQDTTATGLFSKLGEERDRLAGFGGLTRYAGAGIDAASKAVDAGSGKFTALGDIAGSVFNPPKSFAENMAEYAQGINEFKRLSSTLG